MIDVVQQLNAVRRSVGDRTVEAGEAREVTISQTYRAEQADVWDACTNPERIPRWFLPVTGDLRLHGRYRLEGNAEGTVTHCDPPHSFTATWEYEGSVSWIELRLTGEPDGHTRLELTHIVPVDQHWTEYGPGATGIGWDLALVGLRLHLSSGEAVDPAASAAWLASAEGTQFMTLASQRWRDAAVAAGEDEATAQAAADRTTAVYTAEAPDSPAAQ